MTGSAPTDFGFTGQRLDASDSLMYHGARYYDAALGRFVEADTTVPGAGNPQSLNRYAYVNINPLAHVDSSGHCWGAASGIRGVWSYDVTCGNLDMALTIVQSPNASAGEKAFAGGYIAFVGASHVGFAIGAGILAWEAGGALLTAGGGAVTTAAAEFEEADCADKAAETEQTAAQVVRGLLEQAQRRLQSGQQLQLTTGQIQALATESQIAPKAGTTVLGFTEDNFLSAAQANEANAFNVDPTIWNSLPRSLQWQVNKSFLDMAIDAGDRIRLASSYIAGLEQKGRIFNLELN